MGVHILSHVATKIFFMLERQATSGNTLWRATYVHHFLNLTLCSRSRCGARGAMTVGCKPSSTSIHYSTLNATWEVVAFSISAQAGVHLLPVNIVGLQPTSCVAPAPRAKLIDEIQRIVDAHRNYALQGPCKTDSIFTDSLPGYLRLCCFAIGGKRRKEPRSPATASHPGNLTGFELSAKVNKQRRYFLFQSDCLL